MSTEISANDLRPGDWILFQGDPGSWLSKAIMMLTDSDVSHAALYIGDGLIAEEIGDGLVTTEIEERLHRKSYVMRRTDPHPELEPVLATARDYLAEGQKYAFSTLVLLGMILLYKRFTMGSMRRRAIVRILKAASLEVFGLIEKFSYQGKTPMVCSQFVYECFARPSVDNEDYRLRIEQPLLEAVQALGAGETNEEAEEVQEGGALIDELLRFPVPESLAAEPVAFASLPGETTAEDPEELARALVEALEATEDDADDDGVDTELFATASRFAALAAPLIRDPEEDVVGLEAMADHKSYFVAPSDLLKVSNGRQVGVIPPQPKEE